MTILYLLILLFVLISLCIILIGFLLSLITFSLFLYQRIFYLNKEDIYEITLNNIEIIEEIKKLLTMENCKVKEEYNKIIAIWTMPTIIWPRESTFIVEYNIINTSVKLLVKMYAKINNKKYKFSPFILSADPAQINGYRIKKKLIRLLKKNKLRPY